ncbi:hypothetical protein IMSAG049_00791 [Clostridiales bacterium]|nr:hypothetical protein IMSAG049_00791 [Clostridiales bacterium]
MRQNLKDISAKDLVNEFTSKEGVETITAEPYEELSIPVNGPAAVLVVID